MIFFIGYASNDWRFRVISLSIDLLEHTDMAISKIKQFIFLVYYLQHYVY